MIVRELITRLGFDGDESKVRSFEGAVKGLVGGLTLAVGAMKAVNAAAFGLANAAARVGDEVAKTGRQLGVSAEALQEYRFAFDRLGVSEGEATAGLERFSRALGRAGQGSKTEAGAFEALGVNIRNADGSLRNMEDLLPEAADGLAAIQNEAERAAMAQDLFGRSGGRLAMALAAGGAEIENLREEFRLLGGGLTNEQAKAAEEFTDTMTNLRTVLNGIKLQIGAELMPVFRPMLQAFTEFMALNRASIIEKMGAAFEAISGVFQRLTGFAMDVFNGITRLLSLFGEGDDATRNFMIAMAALLFIFRRKWFFIGLLLAVLDDFLAWQQGQESVLGRLIGDYETWAARIDALVEKFGGWENAATALKAALGLLVALKVAAWIRGIAAALGLLSGTKALAGVATLTTLAGLSGKLGTLAASLGTLSKLGLLAVPLGVALGADALDKAIVGDEGRQARRDLQQERANELMPQNGGGPNWLDRLQDSIRRNQGGNDVDTERGGVIDPGSKERGGVIDPGSIEDAIRDLRQYLELSAAPDAPNAEAVAGGDIDNSKQISLNAQVTQNITVPPGTTAEQLAVIRSEAQRTIEREINRAATALEG